MLKKFSSLIRNNLIIIFLSYLLIALLILIPAFPPKLKIKWIYIYFFLLWSFLNYKFGAEYKFIIFVFSSMTYLFLYNIILLLEYIGFPTDYPYLLVEFLSFFLNIPSVITYHFDVSYTIIGSLLILYLLLKFFTKNRISKVPQLFILSIAVAITILSGIIYITLLSNILALPYKFISSKSQYNNLFFSFTAFHLAKYIYSQSKFYKTNKGFIIIINDKVYNLTEISYKYSSSKTFCKVLQNSVTFQDFFSKLVYNYFTSYIDDKSEGLLNIDNNNTLGIYKLPIIKILRSYYPITYLRQLEIHPVSNKDFFTFKKELSKLCKTKY